MIAVVVRRARRALALSLIGAALLPPTSALAQVFQTGAVIPQHYMMWGGSNVAQDAGGAARLPQGLQPFELGIVAPPNLSGSPFPSTAAGAGPNGENSCIYDSPLGQAGHYLCFSPNVGSNVGAITFGSVGGGAVGGLEFIVNGTKIPFPGAGGGNVSGPGSSVVGDLACWNNTLGTLLSDCAIASSAVLTTTAAAAIYAPLNSPTLTGVPLSTTPATVDNSTKIATTAFVKAQGYLTSVSVPLATPQGRLTLTSHTPVITGAGVLASSTIFYDAYLGNSVPVYNGSTDVPLTIGGNEITLILTSLEESAANVFDVFAINVSGTLTLCTPTNAGGSSGKGWAGDTGGGNATRGTGYSQLNTGVRSYYTNANIITNCFGGASGTTNFGPIAANQGTYLGTYQTIGAGQTAFSLGGAASGGIAPQMQLWNYYNRVSVAANTRDTGAPYTYTASTGRVARASASMSVSFVIGVYEDAVQAAYQSSSTTVAAGAFTNTCIGIDSSSSCNFGAPAIAGGTGFGSGVQTSVPSIAPGPATGPFATNGAHNLFAIEASDGVNANTFDSTSTGTLMVIIKM